MAKEMLKIGDLVQWRVPSLDKTPIHAMVIDYCEDGDMKFWTAMRGDGTKWAVSLWGFAHEKYWWDLAQIGDGNYGHPGCRTCDIIV